jgi:hypothetical protein
MNRIVGDSPVTASVSDHEIVIESRWLSKPLALAGGTQPRRPNHQLDSAGSPAPAHFHDQSRGWNRQNRTGISVTASAPIMKYLNSPAAGGPPSVAASVPAACRPPTPRSPRFRNDPARGRPTAPAAHPNHKPVIESRWVSKPLALAGGAPPRRLNEQPCLRGQLPQPTFTIRNEDEIDRIVGQSQSLIRLLS